MLLRVVLFLGVVLIAVAGGAAGWQYWQSLPQTVAVAADAAPTSAAPKPVSAPPLAPAEGAAQASQNWLISAGGGLVPREDVRNFLGQHKFDETRGLRFQFRAPLSALLSEGEVLPDPVFAEAFAEVRAMAVATRLCEPLLQAWAQGCAVASAELVEESYEQSTQTAEFMVNVVFTLKPEAAPLPDLGTRSFRSDYVRFTQDDVFINADTPETLLASALETATLSCRVLIANDQPCRVMQMSLIWENPEKAQGHVEIGVLGPLPQGMYAAPPLY